MKKGIGGVYVDASSCKCLELQAQSRSTQGTFLVEMLELIG